MKIASRTIEEYRDFALQSAVISTDVVTFEPYLEVTLRLPLTYTELGDMHGISKMARELHKNIKIIK